MSILNIFIGVSIIILCLCFIYMIDIYPVNNKRTKKIEWWLVYWLKKEKRYIRFKLFERKYSKH